MDYLPGAGVRFEGVVVLVDKVTGVWDFLARKMREGGRLQQKIAKKNDDRRADKEVPKQRSHHRSLGSHGRRDQFTGSQRKMPVFPAISAYFRLFPDNFTPPGGAFRHDVASPVATGLVRG
jgi:hypothetical protein